MFSKILFVFLLFFAQSLAQNQTQTASAAPLPPKIDWGRCPQLEPSEADKTAKASVLELCLKENPVPKNLTEETIDKHQRQIAECALRKEKWFSKSGSYRFSKAETEIKNKKLVKDVEQALIQHHKKCEGEAKAAFPKKEMVIEQVQLYQACMDFHITETCQIKVTPQTPPTQ